MKHNVLLLLTILFTGFQGTRTGEKDEFKCPEEFGYYKHPKDCSKYYVCVFGGPLLESCTGGLMYSHELQTCDWPRNVVCKREPEKPLAEGELERIPRRLNPKVNPAIEDDVSSAASYDDFGQKSNSENTTSSSNTTISTTTSRTKVNSTIRGDQVSTTEKLSISSTESTTKSSSSTRDDLKETDRSFKADYNDSDDPDDDKEDLLTAKSTELLLSPPVSYDSDSDLDAENEFYDLEVDVKDDDFYYVSWKDPIYDYQGFDSTKIRKVPEVPPTSVKVNYTNFPKRPPVVNPELQHVKARSKAVPCKPQFCKLPDCSCGTTKLKELEGVEKTPQIVMFTFDDSVSDLNKNLYKEIFSNHRTNPNGCPITATFYISHEWTDYSQVQNLYADGHEIASHSISHSFGEQFSKRKWMKEMVGQRELIAAFAGVDVEDVRGMRAPFLAIGGDNMFEMMYEANFTYDSSMPIYENNPPPFPFTFDYKISHDCMIPPCPEKAYPGLWEIPLVMWNDLGNGRCSMADACSNPSTAEDVYKLLMQNFQRHYSTNRSPFGLFYHAAWFTQPHHKIGFETFLDTLVSMEDVWIVTSWQAIQYIRSLPDKIDPRRLEAFQCKKEKTRKYCTNPKVCNLWHKSGVRYMRTCQDCPATYPWTGDTGIVNSLADKADP